MPRTNTRRERRRAATPLNGGIPLPDRGGVIDPLRVERIRRDHERRTARYDAIRLEEEARVRATIDTEMQEEALAVAHANEALERTDEPAQEPVPGRGARDVFDPLSTRFFTGQGDKVSSTPDIEEPLNIIINGAYIAIPPIFKTKKRFIRMLLLGKSPSDDRTIKQCCQLIIDINSKGSLRSVVKMVKSNAEKFEYLPQLMNAISTKNKIKKTSIDYAIGREARRGLAGMVNEGGF